MQDTTGAGGSDDHSENDVVVVEVGHGPWVLGSAGGNWGPCDCDGGWGV